MNSRDYYIAKVAFLGVILLAFALGCSGGSKSNNPLVPQTPEFEQAGAGNLDILPIIAFDDESAIGVMGGYNLTISRDDMSADLVPMRSTATGEAYIVSGLAYFTITPCSSCLKIDKISLDTDGNIALGFSIKHPFKKGNPGEPPSGANRLDLDVFDVALVVKPRETTPVYYSFTNAYVYTETVKNPDGYTNELSSLISENSILPYKICYHNANNNRFEMGTDFQSFYVVFAPGNHLTFDLYLTMAYGASAKKTTRLNPTYWIPEFNRKPAWKVVVQPVSWIASDPSTVNIDIYDWNHGATVAEIYPDPNHTNEIQALSNVQSVTIEVPGMTNSIISAETTDTTSNGWDDPLIYTATFTNEKGLASGLYTGIVKVTDSRTPGAASASDSLIHAPGGTALLETYSIPEFATYQTFTASISYVAGNLPPVWDTTVGIQSATPDNASITVTFGTATDPEANNPVTYDLYYVDESTGNNKPFESPNVVITDISSPYTLSGLTNDRTYWLGVRAKDSLGLSETNTVKKSAIPTPPDSNGSLYWAKRAGGQFIDSGEGIVTLPDNSTVVTGRFEISATFGQDEANQITLTAAGHEDMFIAKYDPSGTLAWAKRAGGPEGNDIGFGITALSGGFVGDTVVTGSFRGSATFGPGEANQTILNGATGWTNCFIARYDPDGLLKWAKVYGSWGDEGRGIISLPDNSTVMTGSDDGDSIFITRYLPDGTLLWNKETNYSTSGTNYGFGITKLSGNSAVITGCFNGTVTFGSLEPNQTILISEGYRDIFIAKYDLALGALQWARRAGGAYNDYCQGITTLSDDSTVVTGSFIDVATFGKNDSNETSLTSDGWDDIFVARYNPDGTLAWAKRAGGTGSGTLIRERGYAITALSDDSTVVTGNFGETPATFGPDDPNETTLTSAGGSDIFFARYDQDGALMWAKRAGSAGTTNNDQGFGITTLSDDSTVATGCFYSLATFGPGETYETILTSAGAQDIFVARFAP